MHLRGQGVNVPPLVARRLPLWAQGDATTLPGYGLVITEVDWYAVDPVVAFVLEVSDGEAVESLLYGRHSHVDPGAPAGHGSWRSVQGAPVPPAGLWCRDPMWQGRKSSSGDIGWMRRYTSNFKWHLEVRAFPCSHDRSRPSRRRAGEADAGPTDLVWEMTARRHGGICRPGRRGCRLRRLTPGRRGPRIRARSRERKSGPWRGRASSALDEFGHAAQDRATACSLRDTVAPRSGPALSPDPLVAGTGGGTSCCVASTRQPLVGRGGREGLNGGRAGHGDGGKQSKGLEPRWSQYGLDEP